MSISLPPSMTRQFEHVRRAEKRTPSDLVREALRHYFASRVPVVEVTKAELAAIRRGRAQIRRGQYVAFEQLQDALATHHRQARPKAARKASR